MSTAPNAGPSQRPKKRLRNCICLFEARLVENIRAPTYGQPRWETDEYATSAAYVSKFASVRDAALMTSASDPYFIIMLGNLQNRNGVTELVERTENARA